MVDTGGQNARHWLDRETVYRQLRALAQHQMEGARPGNTLNATALVHEAFLKLAGGRPAAVDDRAHFYRLAAAAMRQILIDHARAKGAAKRGGSWRRSMDSLDQLAEAGNPEDIMALDEAFSRLETDDPRAAEVARLRFFAGLSVDETAAALGISRRSVLRDWEYARASLRVWWGVEDGRADEDADG